MPYLATRDVSRMTERALWTAALATLDLLDPRSPSYLPGQLGHAALELRQILLELRKRGTQLSFFPPAPQ